MLQSKKWLLYLLSFCVVQAFCQQSPKIAYSEGLAPKKVMLKSGVGLYGFVDAEGKLAIKPTFDSVISGFRSGFAVAVKNRHIGVINKKGKEVIPFQFIDVATPFGKNLIPVENKQRLWGFYSKKGKKQIECKYNNFRFRDKGRIIVQKNGLWGVINSKGETVLAHRYRELDVANDPGFYKAIRYNDWILKDAHNDKQKRIFSFDSLSAAGYGVLKYYMLGKYGLVDIDGTFITSYLFDSIGTEKSGNFKVKIGNKYGVINNKGETVLPVRFEQIIIDKNHIRAAVKSKEAGIDLWGLYSLEGKEQLAAAYSFLGEAGEGLIPVRAENGIWKYIDFKDKTIIPFGLSKAGKFKDGVAEVKEYMTEYKVIINTKGEIVIDASELPFYKYGLLWLDRNNKKIWKITRENYNEIELLNKDFFRVKRAGKYGLLTKDDKLTVPCKYDFVSEPSDGYVVVRTGKKWGVIEQSGKIALAPTNRFEKIFAYKEGYAKVLVDGKYGFIDPHGNIYISMQYSDAGYVSNGMIPIKINGKWGFVNTDEKLSVQPYYDQVWPFHKGAAIVYLNGKYNLVNKEGEELYEPLDQLKVTSTGKYLLIAHGKFGLADASGKEILPVKYNLVQEVEGGHMIVDLRGLFGVLDTDNNIVIPITYNGINYDAYNKFFICGSKRGFEKIKAEGKGEQ